MARFCFVLRLLAVALAFGALAPRPASAAGGFAPQWIANGWTFVTNLGNLDGDPGPELLFSSNADGHYAVFDGASGAIQQEFPEFYSPDYTALVIDVDNNGAPELMFRGLSFGPALCKVYAWNGSTFTLIFQHTERFESLAMVPLRSTSQLDILEFASDQVRIRNPAGTVIWRSTQLGPGLGAYAYTFNADLDNDGIQELLVTGQAGTYMVKYNGAAFLPQWNVSDWLPNGAVRTQNDSAWQIGMNNLTDGRYGLFNALTGAQVGDFPGFSFFDGAQTFFVELVPGGGRTEIIHWQPPGPGPVTPKFHVYRWGGSGYDLFLAHTDPVTSFDIASLRAANASEFIETDANAGDVRIRDVSGNVLFRASTHLPGWVVGPRNNLVAGAIDLLHDGSSRPRVLIADYPGSTRLVGYNGASFFQAWTRPGWYLGNGSGNFDDDPQDELLMVKESDHTFGVVDGLTGSLGLNPTNWTEQNSAADVYDADGDGRKELLFYRPSLTPASPAPLAEQFRWNGRAHVSMFQFTDSLLGLSSVQLVGPTNRELLELSPSGDLVLRDAVTGQLAFRASAEIPGWIPLDITGSTPFAVGDYDGDGVGELMITAPGRTILLGLGNTTAVAGPAGPSGLRLLSSMPNPFRTGTSLRFELPRAGQVDVRIFDTAGRLVRRLGGSLPAGPNALEWNGRDESGNPAPSGVLFWEVETGGVRKAGKMVRVR